VWSNSYTAHYSMCTNLVLFFGKGVRDLEKNLTFQMSYSVVFFSNSMYNMGAFIRCVPMKRLSCQGDVSLPQPKKSKLEQERKGDRFNFDHIFIIISLYLN